MTIFDLRAVQGALYARLKSDPAGAAFRALLGAGSPSVIPADALKPGSLPDRPLAAFRAEGVGGSTLEMRNVTVRWWLYDDPSERYARITALIAELQAAYRPSETAIPFGRVEVSGIGPETFDETLGLVCRSVQITYYRRG